MIKKFLSFIIIAILFSIAKADKLKQFELNYIIEIPQTKGNFSLWVPLPKNTPLQKILEEKITSPYKYEIKKEPVYKNKILYISIKNPKKTQIKIYLKIKRYETKIDSKDNRKYLLKKALSKTRYIPISKDIQKKALKICKGKKTILEKAKALYYHTLSTMEYDKSIPGWGKGDFFYAEKVCKGNCTDFHTYFITLARNINIPAIFVIGFSIPKDKKEGIIKSYHCWSGFWNRDRWIYIDISEADKNPKLKDYYFGNLDPYRVEFSIGRDIRLNPKQKSQPLNYFIYPYAELNGKPYKNIKHYLTFKILN